MAVKIKLARVGKKKSPKYRIIAIEEGRKCSSKYLDKIGFYDPLSSPHKIELDKQKLSYWLERGAQLSEGTRKILKSLKVT